MVTLLGLIAGILTVGFLGFGLMGLVAPALLIPALLCGGGAILCAGIASGIKRQDRMIEELQKRQ